MLSDHDHINHIIDVGQTTELHNFFYFNLNIMTRDKRMMTERKQQGIIFVLSGLVGS